jgi:signal transduction histidine kinase/ActR/RegA family two-component response regulator
MAAPLSSPVSATSALPKVARIIGATAIIVGLVVALGWIRDVPALRSFVTGFAGMKLNAALGFVLAGASLWLLSRQGSRTRAAAAQVCALIVSLIGLLTLSEYLFGWQLGIDELLLADRSGDSPYPGRIPLVGACNFLLLGLLLLLLDSGWGAGNRRQRGWLAQWLAFALATVSFAMLLGFIYNAASLYRPANSSPVALHGVLLFLLLSPAALLARPDRGLVARLSSSDADGQLLRRLLPAVILIPPTLGWLRLKGQDAGLYGIDLGIAIFATTNVVVLSGLVWIAASGAREADAERRAAAQKMRHQLARLDLLNHITRAIGERQDLRSIFQVVVRSLEDHLPIDFGCICQYDAATQTITVASVGVRTGSLASELALPEQARIPVDNNGLLRSVQGTLVYEPDISQAQFPFPQRLARVGLNALVIAPLRVESTVFGVLVAARREAHSFSSGDCEFLRQVSEHVALATHQAELHGALQGAYDDLRQSQQTLAQQERLRALGQMASGIAHDINNALAPMTLYTDSLLEQEPGLSPQGRKQLGTISRAIDDVAHTITRLREFSRPREAQMASTRIDLNQLVQQVVEVTRARWHDLPQAGGVVIDVRTDLLARLPAVTGVETEIRDALTNLVFNAVDAMPEGGILTVSTSVYGDASTDTSGPQAGVTVRDTGAGMDEGTRRRCLEPFFTTKGERGTGLGLAMVYGMAERHGAELKIESTLGAGTSVHLIFPVAEEKAPSTPLASAAAALQKRLRILIIDDDPLVIGALSRALEHDGHSVRAADGGQAGIDEFLAAQQRSEPYAMVITDLGMPYVDGNKVAARIRTASPQTPIVLLTGWGQRLVNDKNMPANVDCVLAKPPKLNELRTAIANLTSMAAEASVTR